MRGAGGGGVEREGREVREKEERNKAADKRLANECRMPPSKIEIEPFLTWTAVGLEIPILLSPRRSLASRPSWSKESGSWAAGGEGADSSSSAVAAVAAGGGDDDGAAAAAAAASGSSVVISALAAVRKRLEMQTTMTERLGYPT